MKQYQTDYYALAFTDSFLLNAGYTPHDPLDAVIILADVTSREGFDRQRFCYWCENWSEESKRAEPRLNAQGKPQDGLWTSAWGRPVRRGSDNPTDACGGCLLAKLEETVVPGPAPLTLEEKAGKVGVTLASLRAQRSELAAEGERWAGRIAAIDKRIDGEEKRALGLWRRMEHAEGKRRVLVQHFATLPGRGLDAPHVATGPVEEHWERWQDFDPNAEGNNRVVPGERAVVWVNGVPGGEVRSRSREVAREGRVAA